MINSPDKKVKLTYYSMTIEYLVKVMNNGRTPFSNRRTW